MAIVVPFRGILYNPDKVSGDEVIAPPYDIITPEYREVLYQKSPYNIVRIDFGKELPGDRPGNDRYERSQVFFEQWLAEEVFVRDEKPCFYAYEIDYVAAGENKRLRGILAMVKLEELGKGVFPHEATHSKPKADRLNLMRACRANISPIYSLYNSPSKITSGIVGGIGNKPFITARDRDGAVHRLFKITDSSHLESIQKELQNKPVFIADGHHRYEVALAFRDEMQGISGAGPNPWDYVMMFLANMSDEGITILPTHRMVKGISAESALHKLENDFIITGVDPVEGIAPLLSGEDNIFGLYLGREKRWYTLKYRGGDLENTPPALRGLDVVILHELILKRDLGITDVAYEMDERESIRRVDNEDFDAAFFLRPTRAADVEKVALSNLRMPPKSTYFYPKLLTGMVINKF